MSSPGIWSEYNPPSTQQLRALIALLKYGKHSQYQNYAVLNPKIPCIVGSIVSTFYY